MLPPRAWRRGRRGRASADLPSDGAEPVSVGDATKRQRPQPRQVDAAGQQLRLEPRDALVRRRRAAAGGGLPGVAAGARGARGARGGALQRGAGRGGLACGGQYVWKPQVELLDVFGQVGYEALGGLRILLHRWPRRSARRDLDGPPALEANSHGKKGCEINLLNERHC
jgi:hypothetical protein